MYRMYSGHKQRTPLFPLHCRQKRVCLLHICTCDVHILLYVQTHKHAHKHSYVHTCRDVHAPMGTRVQTMQINIHAQYLHSHTHFQTRDPQPTGQMKVNFWANSTSHMGFALGSQSAQSLCLKTKPLIPHCWELDLSGHSCSSPDAYSCLLSRPCLATQTARATQQSMEKMRLLDERREGTML